MKQIFILFFFISLLLSCKENNKQTENSTATILETKVLWKQKDRYIAWPTIVRTDKNELLVVFSGNRDGHICPYGITQMIRSRDNGKTWSEPEIINNTPLDDRDPGIIQTKNGTLLVSWWTSASFTRPGILEEHPEWRRHAEKVSEDAVNHWLGNWTRRSADGGKTWEQPVKQTVSASHGPVSLSDGRIIYVGIAKINGERKVAVEESSDDGRSWTVISTIDVSADETVNHFHEPHVVEMENNRLITLVRYIPEDRADPHYLHQAESTDGGRTWSILKPTPMNGYPAHLQRLQNGWILAVYGVRRSPYSQRACISRDGGKTWDIENEIILNTAESGDLGYPASVQLDDGSIYTVYYQIDKPGEKTCLMGTRWKLK